LGAGATDDVLRKCRAKGADRAQRLWDEAIIPSDAPEEYHSSGTRNPRLPSQTVLRLNTHLSRRLLRDVGDPRGGARHMISAKADYKAELNSGSTPDHGLVK
jgi:hypothetical protein